MSEYSINFDTLKFNLYEILNVSENASEKKIKKAYRNLILHFHPDKNNKTEEEIYYHIITANEILTNDKHRKKYNDFLNQKSNTFDDLKNNFNKKEESPITKEEALVLFEKKTQELQTKHNLNINNYETIKQKYEKIIKDRKNEIEIPIPPENINDLTNLTNFNLKFEEKKNDNTFNNDKNIIINDNYTTLDIAFNNLYVDDDIVSNNYTSLSNAFKIQNINTNINNIDIDSAIKKYKNETTVYTDPLFKFTQTKFEKW